MAKVDTEQLAVQALSRALMDSAPKVMFGSKMKPGTFEGSGQAQKQAAQICLDHGWLEATGQFEGKGKSRKEVFRVTPAGAQAALSRSEPVSLLRDSLAHLEKLAGLKEKVDETFRALQQQNVIMAALLNRWQPPDLKSVLANIGNQSAGSSAKAPAACNGRAQEIIDYLADYQQRHPYGHCPLPELFHRVGEPHGLTIGQFHDCLRRLIQEKKVRLHPFTGAAYQLQEEQYALVAGQEIKYYAERLAGA